MAVIVMLVMFQHTAARRRLAVVKTFQLTILLKFQHTAARRRLGYYFGGYQCDKSVSTHSRPKAAGA